MHGSDKNLFLMWTTRPYDKGLPSSDAAATWHAYTTVATEQSPTAGKFPETTSLRSGLCSHAKGS